jgi:hypothetical protein
MNGYKKNVFNDAFWMLKKAFLGVSPQKRQRGRAFGTRFFTGTSTPLSDQ